MTHLDALDQLKQALLDLRLEDAEGNPLHPIDADERIAKTVGSPYADARDRFSRGATPPARYLEEVMTLISEFKRIDFPRRLAQRLQELHADQVELDIVKGGAA